MADQMAEDLVIQFKEAFALFDENGNGVIDPVELGPMMRALGQNPTESELQDMIKEMKVPTEGTGEKKENEDPEEVGLTFEKFLEFMAAKLNSTDNEEELKEAFRIFDKEGMGFVCASELRYIMTHMGEKLSEEEVNEMMRETEIDQDGQINYEKFVNMMSSY